VAADQVEPVISVKDLGIRFRRGRRPGLRRRHASSAQASVPVEKGKKPREFWAMRHVSFDVAPGEAVGLVGGNGSGKSTLLRLLTGVLLPDEGTVEVRGGVAPLIEVTGGFVNDLTARENIIITAGLHGLRRKEIDARFDEIVEFAEIQDFVDTPFRHFSSGMKARLGFAVITQLDEPILLVDEVLAVGDRKFRRKCNARLQEMLSEGRTLFLVSHREQDLRRFCSRGLYMRGGELALDADIDTVLARYGEDADRS
jgi:ABC-2 type transport system ATP-binding protein